MRRGEMFRVVAASLALGALAAVVALCAVLSSATATP